MTDKVQTVRAALQEARSGLDNLLSNEEMLRKVVEAADLMVASMKQNGKVMSCGNGGSLCDAMHFAEELSGRFRQDRPCLRGNVAGRSLSYVVRGKRLRL